MYSPNVHILGTLRFQPFHSLIVTPVVALLTDNAILDKMKAGEGEVDHIFSYPLEAVLSPELAPGIETLVEQGGLNWPYEPAYHVINERTRSRSACLTSVYFSTT